MRIEKDVLAQLTEALYTFLAYVVPPIAAYGVGAAIGDAFSGPFTFATPTPCPCMLSAYGLELLLPALGFAVVTTFKRALKERTQMAMFIVTGFAFPHFSELAIALLNCS